MTDDVIVEVTGTLGRIRLNRPKAINSLSLEMVQEVAAAVARFDADPAVSAVLLTGEGERGLCAGGDIRALYTKGRDGSGFGERFFRVEYRLNAHIARFSKPYVAVMDGITMGGGVGLSAHGNIRIVTERTRMAMPETGIGFFPDVGGTWLLSRSPGEVGTFVGLTGDGFGGADAIYAGFADVFVPSETLPALIEALGTSTDVRATVAEFAQDAPAPLAAHRTEIDAAFAFDRVEDIFAALEASSSDFAQKALAVLRQKSPTSLKVTLRLLRLARKDARLEDSLEREFAAAHAVLLSDEFYEGVRAAVVDKDRNPKWSPATLDGVSDALVEDYFAHSPEKIF